MFRFDASVNTSLPVLIEDTMASIEEIEQELEYKMNTANVFEGDELLIVMDRNIPRVAREVFNILELHGIIPVCLLQECNGYRECDPRYVPCLA